MLAFFVLLDTSCFRFFRLEISDRKFPTKKKNFKKKENSLLRHQETTWGEREKKDRERKFCGDDDDDDGDEKKKKEEGRREKKEGRKEEPLARDVTRSHSHLTERARNHRERREKVFKFFLYSKCVVGYGVFV